MSTHWFHDHMFSFTSQNVYKGNAAMFNIYSGLDRGNEDIDDGVNLRLPSGTAKDWGNLDYDVNLMLADKAWDRDGQLAFDIFNFDGFLGDVMTVNLAYKPYFEVERRKYRFRILNASVVALLQARAADASGWRSRSSRSPTTATCCRTPVPLTQLDEQGIAERYDIVIDFSRYSVGDKVCTWSTCASTRTARSRRSDLVAGRGALGHLGTIRASAGSSSSASCAIRRRPTSARCRT